MKSEGKSRIKCLDFNLDKTKDFTSHPVLSLATRLSSRSKKLEVRRTVVLRGYLAITWPLSRMTQL